MLIVSIRLGIVYAISKILHDLCKRLIAVGLSSDLPFDLQFDLPLNTSFLSFILTLAKIQAAGVGGSSAKALEGALRPETESTAYKSLDTVLLCLSFC